MLEIWLRMSYMVELIVGAILFLIPVKKRDHVMARGAISAVCFIAVAYMIDGLFDRQAFGYAVSLYWAFYIVACILFIWICMESTWLEATYCALCVCAMQHVAFDLRIIFQNLFGQSNLMVVVIYVLVYASFYYLFARNLPIQGKYSVTKEALFPMATIILIVLILSVLEASNTGTLGIGGSQQILYRTVDALCCFYVLWVQINQKERLSLQREVDGVNHLLRQQAEQYQMTSETIDSINRKSHDLKHQIQALRHMTSEEEKETFFSEIENDIMIYDATMDTGNKALDTVLMEKGLYCNNNQIQWSCMADGSMLDFMKLEDIYAILGNALDNAIAEVQELTNPEKRIISVRIFNQKSLVMIQIQNYFNKNLEFEAGLPLTTKKNKLNHGYGLKSIQHTVEKYNGTITIKADKQIFMLQLLIPAHL